MNRTSSPSKLLMIACAAGAITAAWAQGALTLQYKGDVVSRGLRVINGVTYVPLSDVARILGGSAARTSGGYQIELASTPATAGGANQVNGKAGKVGAMLFIGKWRFEVAGVTNVPQFQTQYEATPETISPSGANDEVVVVSCLVKNAQNQPEQLGLRTGNMYNTALADDQGQSYPPIAFDFPGGSGYGPSMLPGASCHFNALFSVPKGTKITSLVFSLWSYSHNVPDDVRISLTQ